jgi:spermidine dehydrogenase
MHTKKPSELDIDLGMTAPISRRDFFYGLSSLGALAAVGVPSARAEADVGHAPAYPPALSGMRGNHPGSFETAHAYTWQGGPRTPEISGKDERTYDLIVVGAGVSGLSAAHFFATRNPGAKILILDNHDDFGGHAKRNEFEVDGRMLLGHGGSQSLESPGHYSKVAKQLLRDLRIDAKEFDTAFDINFYKRNGLATATYFDARTFGESRLVPMRLPIFQDMSRFPMRECPSIAQTIAQLPLSETGKRQLQALFRGELTPKQTLAEADLQKISYSRFLIDVMGVDDPGAHTFLSGMTTPFTVVGIDAIPAAYAIEMFLPGPKGVAGAPGDEPYIHHFPDGNASVARLLVRSLIPQALSGKSMRDIVTVRADYDALDKPGNDVRIRLSSTVVKVNHAGDPRNAETVAVEYVRDGKRYLASGRKCIMACYNMMIPYLCNEIPDTQAQALRSLVKQPLVYTNVALTNWRACKKLGIGATYSPGQWHNYVFMDFPVSLGEYHYSHSPDEPVVLDMNWTPRLKDGSSQRDQSRGGRRMLLATSFEDIEREVRGHLAGLLGPGGFDPVKDIAAITVNRWAHGYAFSSDPLHDHLDKDTPPPYVAGRQRIGPRIAIANSDSGGRPYLDGAIDEAWRAVSELSS